MFTRLGLYTEPTANQSSILRASGFYWPVVAYKDYQAKSGDKPDKLKDLFIVLVNFLRIEGLEPSRFNKSTDFH
jgi:hypothetical protein